MNIDENTINAPGSAFSLLGESGTVNNNQSYHSTTNQNSNHDDRRQNTSNFGLFNVTIGSHGYHPRSPQDAETGRLWADLLKRVAIGASYDSAERADPPRCHKETRKAVLANFTSWGRTVSSDSVRWLTGPDGTGKSAIAQVIAETFARKNCLAASFFFRGKSRDRNCLTKFVGSIAYQLAAGDFRMRQIIGETILYDATLFEKTVEGQWQKLVVDTLRRIQLSSVPLLIVIDGVNECFPPSQRIKLVNLILDSIKQLDGRLKVLITSRPDPYIARVFHEFELDELHHIRLGESETDDADILSFLTASFRQIYNHHRLHRPAPWMMATSGTEWPSKKVLNELVYRASRRFSEAVKMVAFVDNDKADPKDRLETLRIFKEEPLPQSPWRFKFWEQYYPTTWAPSSVGDDGDTPTTLTSSGPPNACKPSDSTASPAFSLISSASISPAYSIISSSIDSPFHKISPRRLTSLPEMQDPLDGCVGSLEARCHDGFRIYIPEETESFPVNLI